MLDALKHLDAKTAAGVLADAAMRLDGYGGEARPSFVENQAELEACVIDDLRHALRLPADDFSNEAVALLTEALDYRADQLAGSSRRVSNVASVDDLSANGLLPSDVFHANFGAHLSINFGSRWNVEQTLANLTIKQPDLEQHIFGLPTEPTSTLVSLFARYFWHKYPAKGFWLLVVCGRAGAVLDVAQVWRLYPSEVDLSNCETLLDAVHAFARTFGKQIELDGKTDNFFLSASKNAVQSVFRKIKFDLKKGQAMTMTVFSQESSNGDFAHLIMSVDLTAYFRAVAKWRGWDPDILSQIDSGRYSIAPARLAT